MKKPTKKQLWKAVTDANKAFDTTHAALQAAMETASLAFTAAYELFKAGPIAPGSTNEQYAAALANCERVHAAHYAAEAALPAARKAFQTAADTLDAALHAADPITYPKPTHRRFEHVSSIWPRPQQNSQG
jgi:hypothetical protein